MTRMTQVIGLPQEAYVAMVVRMVVLCVAVLPGGAKRQFAHMVYQKDGCNLVQRDEASYAIV